MFNFIKRVFGAPSAAKEVIGVIRDAGDALVYTDEEKAQDGKERTQMEYTFINQWMTSTQGQNLSRRFLAMLVGCLWAFLFIFSWVSDMVAIWVTEGQEQVVLMGEANAIYLEKSTGAMMLVLAFYFAAPHMGTIVKGAMDKFSGTPGKDASK